MNTSPWPEAEALRQSLLGAWNEHPPASLSRLRQARFVPPPKTYTYSRVYEFVLELAGGGILEVVAKVPVEDQTHTLFREFRALAYLARHFSTQPDLSVPHPLLLLDQPPALVMEKGTGVRLVRQVQSCRRLLRRKETNLSDQFRRAGRWLAQLHQLKPLAKSVPYAPARERYEQAFAILQSASVQPSLLAHLQAQLRPRLDHLPPHPSVPLHGDFTLRNILSAPSHITVIDTTLRHTGAAAIDVASFLAALRYIDWGQMWLGAWFYRPSCLAQAQHHFLTSYQAAGGQLDSSTLDTFIALRCLQRWADFVTHIHRHYPRPGRPLLLWRLHRHFTPCIFELIGTS